MWRRGVNAFWCFDATFSPAEFETQARRFGRSGGTRIVTVVAAVVAMVVRIFGRGPFWDEDSERIPDVR
jgi:hypothetical protein